MTQKFLMGWLSAFTLVFSLSAHAKGTGQIYRNLALRLVNGSHCVLIGTYSDFQSSRGSADKRRAFVVNKEFCRSETARQLVSYTNTWNLEVFLSSNSGSSKDVQEFGSPQAQAVVIAKTGVSEVEAADSISLATEIQSAISDFIHAQKARP